jgi:hypothetical protein
LPHASLPRYRGTNREAARWPPMQFCDPASAGARGRLMRPAVVRQEDGDGSSRQDDRSRSRGAERRRAGHISCARGPLATVGAHSRRARRKSWPRQSGLRRRIFAEHRERSALSDVPGPGSTACRIDSAGVLLAGGTKRSAGSTHSRRRKMGWSGWQGMGSTSQSQAARCGERIKQFSGRDTHACLRDTIFRSMLTNRKTSSCPRDGLRRRCARDHDEVLGHPRYFADFFVGLGRSR